MAIRSSEDTALDREEVRVRESVAPSCGRILVVSGLSPYCRVVAPSARGTMSMCPIAHRIYILGQEKKQQLKLGTCSLQDI